MVNERPLILITNDDGYQAKGINELVECLRDLGELVVFAPDGARSGMGSAITSEVPISYSLIKKENGVTVYSCTGTPVDCVKLAISVVLDRRPDLLVSGINHGGNMALAVRYSGTMGAAAEGCVFDIPSLGVSLLAHEADADFSESCRFARLVARRILKEGLPHGTYMNLNIPNIPHVKGMKICRQADGKWEREFMKSEAPRREPFYWLTGGFESRKPIHPENDMLALDSGYASLVPCKLDVTDYDFMKRINHWEQH
ncbi:5'/3'-nucleotidase SurE [Parabacteroides sp. OttesenSCG-928-N08]|nr:5'/3'-nucleotidase SurE [Parabacteroides sp. OttesenSCG-928-N08]